MAYAGDIRRSNIPIVGQAFKIKSWVCIVNAECQQCTGDPETGEKYLLTLVSRLAVVCPGCGAEYNFRGMVWDHRTNEASFAISHTSPDAKRLEYEQQRH